jgi:hypothetical protein
VPQAAALDNSVAIAISPDGASVYAASEGDDAIQIFGVDPPDTALVAGPKAKTVHRGVTFRFGSDEPGATFTCSRDGGDFAACVSPVHFRVKPGQHTFSVLATDQSGNSDETASDYQWKVKKRKH